MTQLDWQFFFFYCNPENVCFRSNTSEFKDWIFTDVRVTNTASVESWLVYKVLLCNGKKEMKTAHFQTINTTNDTKLVSIRQLRTACD